MKTLVHLSDLHFGTAEKEVVEALAAEIRDLGPDLVVVSGDLTQRARKAEFLQARAFLDLLPSTQIVVPGNHDVPLYHVLARALTPMARYKRYINPDLEPYYADAEIAVVGLNTARSMTIKDGRINVRQLASVTQRFADQPANITRVVVTHHPFEGRDTESDSGIVGRARLAMEAFSQSRVDIILSGHLHIHRAGSSVLSYAEEGYDTLLIQAGTAISSRRREALNSFNLIQIERPNIYLECREWQASRARFGAAASYSFRLGPVGWGGVKPVDQ